MTPPTTAEIAAANEEITTHGLAAPIVAEGTSREGVLVDAVLTRVVDTAMQMPNMTRAAAFALFYGLNLGLRIGEARAAKNERGIDVDKLDLEPLGRVQELVDCPDCKKARRAANSDATTPGFFHRTCLKHRPPEAAS